jgi:hypothetical protein
MSSYLRPVEDGQPTGGIQIDAIERIGVSVGSGPLQPDQVEHAQATVLNADQATRLQCAHGFIDPLAR